MSSNIIRKQINSNQKDSISNYLCPSNGFRGNQTRKGVQPKDHMKENYKDLKQAQMILREKKELAAQPEKELYKLSQFKDIPSKLYENTGRQAIRRHSFENQKDFLSKGISDKRREELAMENRASRIELDRKMEEAKYYAAVPDSPRKSSIPKEMAKLAPPTNTNFISQNKVKAITMVPSNKSVIDTSNNNSNSLYKHDEFGRIPEYLEERKAKWAEEEEEIRRKLPDPNCPPGMCLMPDTERLNTLNVLKQSKNEALNQLQKMPFVIETPSLKKKQENLETKLREIDNALNIFSKDRVYIALR